MSDKPGMGRPKLYMALYTLFMLLDVDTEDCESWNSFVKIEARAAPNITAELLSGRVNLKGDSGHCSTACNRHTVREMMQVARNIHDRLLPFANGRNALQDIRKTICEEGRWAHTKLRSNFPGSATVEAAMVKIDAWMYPDFAADKTFSWAAAHSKIFAKQLKDSGTKRFHHLFYFGDVNPAPGTVLYMPADSCRSLHFLVEWVLGEDGYAKIANPMRSRSSFEVFLDYFSAVHSEEYDVDALIKMQRVNVNWSAWTDTSHGVTFPAGPGPGGPCPLMDLRPGRSYAVSEKNKRAASDTLERVLEEGATDTLEDMRYAFFWRWES